MKALIFSDSHGKHEHLFSVLRKEKNVDAVLHLGDLEGGEEEIRREIEKHFPLAAFKAVPGNCDISTDKLPYFVYKIPGTNLRIFMTHGHRYHVSNGTELLETAARKENCSAAFYGHTHIAKEERRDGLLIYNPGSISLPRGEKRRPSYGIMTISDEGKEIEVQTVFLN